MRLVVSLLKSDKFNAIEFFLLRNFLGHEAATKGLTPNKLLYELVLQNQRYWMFSILIARRILFEDILFSMNCFYVSAVIARKKHAKPLVIFLMRHKLYREF